MKVFRFFSVFILILFGFSPLPSDNEIDKPNLVLILADDLGYADIGIHGSKQIPTPHIDQLAEDGIMFTQAYVSSPVCSPSRAGLITGKNQLDFGFDNNLFPSQPGYDPDFVGLPVEEITLADRLKKLGYTNGIIGKWHLGEKDHFYPTKRGFDEFWGFLGGGHDYFIEDPNDNNMKRPMQSNYKKPEPITYLTDDIGDECVDFIKRHKNEPFFLYACFNAPHGPMQAPEEDLKLFSHIEDEMRRIYCAMVYRMDLNIGKIINTIEKEGIEENTFVVFMSDNGGPTSFNASVNAPLRGQKTTVLEGGIRVPMIFKWPASLESGKTINDMVLSLDLFPSFVNAAGGRITDEDELLGLDIIPFITGKTNVTPHKSMNWKYTVSAAIREGDWKLIRLPDRLPMLYNISEDISELNDLSMKEIEKTKSLLKKLGTWDIYLPHPVFMEPNSWRTRQIKNYDKEYQLTQPEL